MARMTKKQKAIAAQLDARRRLTMAEYEACEQELLSAACASDHTPNVNLLPGLWEQQYEGQGRLVFKGTRKYFREYAWS